jgi:hypothetical protein
VSLRPRRDPPLRRPVRAAGARRVPTPGLPPAAALVLAALAAAGCASPGPPSRPDDLCAIFAERSDWLAGARSAAERWGVPAAVQLAVVHQESSFREDARPPRRRVLGVVPGPRASSARGYGQATDAAWSEYLQAAGRRGADREDFADAVDFIGWYADRAHRRLGIRKDDAYRLYLAYHEGPTGFGRGSHVEKPWLLVVARNVEARAERYARQWEGCGAGSS